ncbi:hypothetical protein QTP70_011587 [Hemibagrus guttatus]|uniref:Sulfotransferase n=1 Tax=Hemibagrus guttatus TaxID=175788 RepID=A0AAE0QQ27_9TELE|nr:hypothetical protein QTP70_011587 [Hemibagrus guttatus]
MVLPCIHLANLRSLPNKMDELLLLSQTNKDFSNSAALCFTESWLNDAIPDNALNLPGFQLLRADRVTESAGKSRGGGTCFYINERWCTDVTALKKMCCPSLEAFFINCKPFYSPWEFSSFILSRDDFMWFGRKIYSHIFTALETLYTDLAEICLRESRSEEEDEEEEENAVCEDNPIFVLVLRDFSRLQDFLKTSGDLMPKTLEGQITMEKTPSYFVTREAPARIYSMSRSTKLIVVVRDPVTRAISDYTQTLSKKPGIPTFESLTFKNRTTGLIDTSWSAIQIGIYAKHLNNWLQFFPMQQILFVSGERLISDPAGELGRVQDFLGLKRIITDKHFYFNKTKGFPCLKKAEGSSKPHCLGKTKGRTHPNIKPEVVQRLRDFYRPFNMKFYQMTGRIFGWDD